MRRIWWLNAPALGILALFAAGPLVVMLVYSFLTPGDYGGVDWAPSTEGWFNVLLTERHLHRRDAAAGRASQHRLALAQPVVPDDGDLPDLRLSDRLFHRDAQRRANRNLWLFLITVPFWTNLLIRTFAMMEWIRNEGIINQVLTGVGVIETPIQMLYTDFSIMLGMTYVYFPLMVLPLYAAMEKLDFRLVEAAYDLYATRWQVLRRVIMPLVKPGIIAGSILVFIPSLGAYVTPRVLGGGKNLMLGNLIELQFGQGRNWPLGAALSITLLVIVMVALIFYVRSVQRSAGERVASAHGRSGSLLGQAPAGLRHGGDRLLPRALCAARDAGRLFLQRRAEHRASGRGSPCAGTSRPGRTSRSRRRPARSLIIASFASVIATVAATMAALGTTRVRPYRGQTAVYALINQPLMVPEIVTAVALLIFFAMVKVATGYQGLGYLIMAHTAFCIPFAYLPIRARLEDMDRTLEIAAADLYATPWKAFRRVTLPLLWPGILAGGMLAFVISLDDVVITEFVKSAGQDTLPTYMLGQLRRVITPEINAISTALVAVSVLIVTIFFIISRRKAIGSAASLNTGRSNECDAS